VEDDRLSLFVYAEFIRNIVTDVYTATNGIEGVAVFREKKPDIIITDIMMPQMDGLEMIRKIKEIDPQVKAIMISGHSEADYFIRSIDLGVDGYLLKPVDNKRLENKITELGRHILLQQKVVETEKKFQDFAALLPQVVFEADNEGKLTFVNKLALKKFNYTKADIGKGLYLHDVISKEHGRDWHDIVDIIRNATNYQEQEVVCRTKNGDLFPALIYTSSIIENGQPAGIRGVMVDITSRKKMMEELKVLNMELEEKVKERTLLLSNEIKEKEKAEKALIKAKEKAEESDQLKGIFLANVSHEIQTPIKAIISFSNLLQSQNQEERRRQELIGIIESNSNALLNLTNDILEFTRLQSKTVKLYKIDFELNLFLKELYPVFESLKKGADKQIMLKMALASRGKSLMIKSDPSRLRQVFSNLISNAFKFTHEGYVEYGYVVEGHNVLFYVKDTGLGISKAYQEKIFERFIQEPKPLNIKKEGTGLGLPITQSLIKLLGGKIWVDSSPGKGSTFYFELPGIVISPTRAEHDRPLSWKDRQVLVIEDEIRDYIRLEEILKTRVRLHYVGSPEQALEFCSVNRNIDVCLCRWSPGSDIGMIDKLRHESPLNPVIALLDRGIKDKHRNILRKHFDGTIIKPYNEGKILGILDRFLS
jgi:PAS domain S-box-containing protein